MMLYLTTLVIGLLVKKGLCFMEDYTIHEKEPYNSILPRTKLNAGPRHSPIQAEYLPLRKLCIKRYSFSDNLKSSCNDNIVEEAW